MRAASDFWQEVRQPGHRRARTLIRQGLDLLIHALKVQIGRQRLQLPVPQRPQATAYAQRAMERFRLARRHAPRDPEALYLLAITRSRWRERHPTSLTKQDETTIEHLERLRRLDSDYHAAVVAFELGILHTRGHRFSRAVAEYERCLEELLPDAPAQIRTPADWLARRLFAQPSHATVHYNLAEVTMQQGDLERAATRYRRAMEAARRSNRSTAHHTRVLSLWGLAAALDRLGEHSAALHRAREAARLDEKPMQILTDEGVFFEPAYELHYLQALGHLALSERKNAERDERLQHLRKAARSWQRFLSGGGSESQWSELARQRLQAVRQRLNELGDKR